MKPSKEALKKLGNKRKITYIGKHPLDPKGCICKKDIKDDLHRVRKLNKMIKEADNLGLTITETAELRHIECKKKGNEYSAYCKKCGELLATFRNKKPVLDRNYSNLHYVTVLTKKAWKGCLGVNINRGKVSFECTCGNREIKKRYTKIIIK